MKISPKYREELISEVNDLSDEQIINLLKIIRIFKETIIQQREHDFQLRKEFEEWDSLSDEALTRFEGAL